MNAHPLEPKLKEAFAAVRHAQDTRKRHARRTEKGNPLREEDLEWAFERVKKAMVPLRSFLGQAPYREQTAAHDAIVVRVTQASKDLQSERRKIWKMKRR